MTIGTGRNSRSSRGAGVTSEGQSALSSSGPTDDDVARTVIKPLYRSVPKENAGGQRERLQVLILGESNICRSPVAEALLRGELKKVGLDAIVGCASKAVRDYAVGESVPESVQRACSTSGLPPADLEHRATMWNPEWDVCEFDLLLAVDHFVAEDALKEVSVWDTIQKQVEYCSKIRGLYEFGGREVEDPLYGNVGGEEEQEALKQAFEEALQPAICGFASKLATALRGGSESGQVLQDRALAQQALAEMLDTMGEFEWDAPPMLRKRTSQALSDGLLSLD